MHRKVLGVSLTAILVGAMLIPLAGTANAVPTAISLTPPTDSASVGTCNQFTATVTSDDPVLAGDIVNITITQSDADTAQDLIVGFCDPDGAGTATNAGGSSDLDDNPALNTPPVLPLPFPPLPGAENPASANGACVTLADGTCSFGVTSNEVGDMTVVASVSDGTTTFSDTSTKTWVTAAVATVDCSPEAATNIFPDVTHTFTCTALSAGGTGVSGAAINFDVTAGPNAEEILPTFCGLTNASGVATCTYTDVVGAGSPPGTDTIVGYQNLACPRPGVATCSAGPEADEPQDSIEKTFADPPRTIVCEPETAENAAGTVHTVTCTVTDRAGNVVPGVLVTFDESGPGRFASGEQSSSDTTDAAGEATADVTSDEIEEGDQTITGSLPTTAGVDECERAADDPAGAPAGACTDDVIKTWTPGPDVIRVPSDVSIRHKFRPRHVFKGAVDSARARCERGRRVLVKKVRSGPDRTVGRDTTNRRGRYVVPHRRGGRGRYYAVVARKSFTNAAGATIICQRDRSARIRVRR